MVRTLDSLRRELDELFRKIEEEDLELYERDHIDEEIDNVWDLLAREEEKLLTWPST